MSKCNSNAHNVLCTPHSLMLQESLMLVFFKDFFSTQLYYGFKEPNQPVNVVANDQVKMLLNLIN